MAKPETITSTANPLLKDVRRAIARGDVTEDGWCVAETFHLLEEALRSECDVKIVLVAESVRSAAQSHVGKLERVKVVVLADALFQGLSGTETSQGVMALVKQVRPNLNIRLAKHLLVRTCDVIDASDATTASDCGWKLNAA